MPGQPEFNEAQSALEKAVVERPNDAGSQIALSQIYLLGGRLDDALARLEAARKMRPDQPAIYAGLAKAYEEGDGEDIARPGRVNHLRRIAGESL